MTSRYTVGLIFGLVALILIGMGTFYVYTPSNTVTNPAKDAGVTTLGSLTNGRTQTSSSTSTAAGGTSTGKTATHTLQLAARLSSNGTELSASSLVEITAAGGGSVQAPSSLPATLQLPAGVAYTITAKDGKGLLFSGWSSGDKSRSVSVLLDQDAALTAMYRPLGSQVITVLGKTLQGKTVAGVVADLYRNGVKVQSDVIPANFTVQYGTRYEVVANGATSLAFRYWNNNQSSTNERFGLKVAANTTITAYYAMLPVPYTPHGKGNYTVEVLAHTMDGGPLVGAYFQIRINGVWNHTVNGFTPASVSVPAGYERVVMYHCSAAAGPCSDKFFVYRYYNDTFNTLTRWKDIQLTGDIVIHSFYEIIPASRAIHLTVQALNANSGQPIYHDCTCGGTITIYHDGKPIAQSLEPYSFFLWKGQNYTVTVGDIPGYTFSKWDNGVTSHTLSFVTKSQTSGGTDQWMAAIYVKS